MAKIGTLYDMDFCVGKIRAVIDKMKRTPKELIDPELAKIAAIKSSDYIVIKPNEEDVDFYEFVSKYDMGMFLTFNYDALLLNPLFK